MNYGTYGKFIYRLMKKWIKNTFHWQIVEKEIHGVNLIVILPKNRVLFWTSQMQKRCNLEYSTFFLDPIPRKHGIFATNFAWNSKPSFYCCRQREPNASELRPRENPCRVLSEIPFIRSDFDKTQSVLSVWAQWRRKGMEQIKKRRQERRFDEQRENKKAWKRKGNCAKSR